SGRSRAVLRRPGRRRGQVPDVWRDPGASPALLPRLRMLVRRPARRRAPALVAGLAAAALLAIGLIVWQSKESEFAPPPPAQAYRPAGPIAPSPAPSPEEPKRTPPTPTPPPKPDPI